MNDMNDHGPAQDSNPQPIAYQANALLTELLGLARDLGCFEVIEEQFRLQRQALPGHSVALTNHPITISLHFQLFIYLFGQFMWQIQ